MGYDSSSHKAFLFSHRFYCWYTVSKFVANVVCRGECMYMSGSLCVGAESSVVMDLHTRQYRISF